MEFHAVRCPNCAARGVRDVPVVLEVATGLARGKCPDCRRRVWAIADGHEVRVGMVDAPRRVVVGGSQTATAAHGRPLRQ